jgi:sortase B
MDRDAKKKQEKNATTTIRRLTIAMVGLLIIAVAGAALLRYYRETNAEADEFDQIALFMEAQSEQSPYPATPAPAYLDGEPVETLDATPQPAQEEAENPQSRKILGKLSELYAQNDELGGWVRIDGTKVNYPVMFTPDNPEKYISLSFAKKYSASGVPFIGEGYTISPRSDNIVLYGHHMRSGAMFATIVNYQKKQFLQKHPVIYFSTLYEEGEYEIFAAIATDLRSAKKLRCYTFVNAADEADFQAFIAGLRAASFYETDVEVKYGDDLLTLSTCAYHTNEGRFIIVARRR